MNRFCSPIACNKTARQFIKTFLLLILSWTIGKISYAQNGVYDITVDGGVSSFAYNQTPADLVSVSSSSGMHYQWEQSDKPLALPATNFTPIPGAVNESYTFSGPLSRNTWFRRRAYNSLVSYYSNIFKVQVVSINWEDRNYVRAHDILIAGQGDWEVIDKLAIGQKLQTTTYMDGLGRPDQKVSRETALQPSAGTELWGDVVQFSKYDDYGREVKHYLSYTTTKEIGKHKSTYTAEQPDYYTDKYNESSPYSFATYEDNPLGRVINVKAPGTSWAAGLGNSATYDLNEAVENVQKWTIDYTTGAAPVNGGSYPANSLYKNISTDENGNNVIEYSDKAGQLILTKTQLDNAPSAAHSGWICVYNVYDGFGRLRYMLQPEAVKYLESHSWSFGGTDGTTVLAEQCFRYEYDDKGHTIRKKAPGADELHMVYDKRDRVVFMQDGAQATKPTHNLGDPEWTANLYDELDRIQIVALYHTTKDMSTLQDDANSAGANTTVTTTVPAQVITNLVVPARPTNNPAPSAIYTARESIEFVGEFESIGNSDNFDAYIDPSATTPATSVSNTVYSNSISNSELNNPSITTILKYLYYDNYAYTGAKPFNNRFENSQAYATGGQPIAPTERTISMPTGSKVRILGTSTFLASTLYYDEDELPIQSLEENIKGGDDITTSQYGWDGRLLSTHTRHSTGSTGYSDFTILTKNLYDKIGRVISLQKKIGSNHFIPIANYDLDDMGRLKIKHLDPDYIGAGVQAGGGLESLTYSYNIHSNIIGINKDYALKAGTYDKWSHYFGLYLGYDDKDNTFASKQLDGHVTGLIWNTMGDDAQRKYDYTYDNAGRLTKAAFTQRETPTDAWSNTKLDFSVGGNAANSGKITYDLNGNLLNMLQKGVQIGNATPITIDDLQYEYKSYSNKLKRVTDDAQATLGAANGQWGDFKDGSNGSTDDYVYDENGNLVIDLNKNAKELANLAGAEGIRYNFLDKPEEIRIPGKGTIKIVYDADATRLQKIYMPDGSNAVTKTTTYINGFVYEEKSNVSGAKLQYLNFEEGRIRVVQPVVQSNGYDYLSVAGNLTLPEGKQGTWDYMVRDYQHNVRMILTEETHLGSNLCTMEWGRDGTEQAVFGQPGSNNEVAITRFDKSNIPNQPWDGTLEDQQVSMLSSTTSTIGPNTLLKVMAGDEITAAVQYYYSSKVPNTTGSPTLINSVIASLVQTLASTPLAGSPLHNGAAGIGSNLQNGPNAGVLSLLTDPDAGNSGTNRPKAYLTVLFFDERMQPIAENSSYHRVEVNGSVQTMGLTSLQAPKNGYAYVYVSNESDEPVYFDNLQVADNRGRIVEENHYYAYGLKIAAISSAKLPDDNEGHVANPNQYQGDFSEMDAEIGWNDFKLRNYDPQIGRWAQHDPYDQFASPYAGMGNDPVNLIDSDGGFSGTATAIGAFSGFMVGGVAAMISGHSEDAWKWALGGAALGAGMGAGGSSINWTSKAISTVSMGVQVSNITLKLSNFHNPVRLSLSSGVRNISWASRFGANVHQVALKKSLDKYIPLSLSFCKIDAQVGVNDGTEEADSKPNQTGAAAPQHAMSNRGKQTKKEAMDAADKFVRDKFEQAIILKDQNNWYWAFYTFAQGLHALQDATSPAHHGFQPWSDRESDKAVANHIRKELFYPGVNSNLQKITDKYIEWFMDSQRAPLPKENLFKNIKSD